MLQKPGLLLLSILFFSACQKKSELLTRQQLEHRSDSLTAIMFEVLQKQAKEDLDSRIAIEVKPKVDSILQHRLSPSVPSPSSINPVDPPQHSRPTNILQSLVDTSHPSNE